MESQDLEYSELSRLVRAKSRRPRSDPTYPDFQKHLGLTVPSCDIRKPEVWGLPEPTVLLLKIWVVSAGLGAAQSATRHRVTVVRQLCAATHVPAAPQATDAAQPRASDGAQASAQWMVETPD